MISEKETTQISKFLSLVLRHKPDTIGIQLDSNGWTDVSELIQKINQTDISIDFEKLKYVVGTNPKKRFSFNETFDRIRASQGHSVEVDLGYVILPPPPILYHGTSEKSIAAILQSGLLKMDRHHVHLSDDIQTAFSVGRRHGRPQVFEVLAGQMHHDRYEFYRSDNGVWLTDHVPAKFIRQLEVRDNRIST